MMSAEGVEAHPSAPPPLVVDPACLVPDPAQEIPDVGADVGAVIPSTTSENGLLNVEEVFGRARLLLDSLPQGVRNRRRHTPRYQDAVGKGDAKARDEKKTYKKKGDVKDGAELEGLVGDKSVKDGAVHHEPERPTFWSLVEVTQTAIHLDSVLRCT
eukprot:1191251-Prorocentrum_minimum.AAC.4